MQQSKELTSDKIHFISWCITYALANSDDVNVSEKAMQCMNVKHATTTEDIETYIKDCDKAFINY